MSCLSKTLLLRVGYTTDHIVARQMATKGELETYKPVDEVFPTAVMEPKNFPITTEIPQRVESTQPERRFNELSV